MRPSIVSLIKTVANGGGDPLPNSSLIRIRWGPLTTYYWLPVMICLDPPLTRVDYCM